jgi:hypothetical protein
MKKIITRIDEFLADTKTKPVTAPPKPGTKPTPPGIAPTTRPSVDPRPIAGSEEVETPVAPPKPGTKPTPPGIAPATRPSVDPRPLAAKDVVNRFMEELKNAKQSIKFDIEKLKKVYGK